MVFANVRYHVGANNYSPLLRHDLSRNDPSGDFLRPCQLRFPENNAFVSEGLSGNRRLINFQLSTFMDPMKIGEDASNLENVRINDQLHDALDILIHGTVFADHGRYLPEFPDEALQPGTMMDIAA